MPKRNNTSPQDVGSKISLRLFVNVLENRTRNPEYSFTMSPIIVRTSFHCLVKIFILYKTINRQIYKKKSIQILLAIEKMSSNLR